MAKLSIEDIIHKFSSITAKPVKYLSVQRALKKDIKKLVKSLYELKNSQEQDTKTIKDALPKIIVKNFCEEQIWQQIELQNNDCWDELVSDVANFISPNNNLTFPIKIAQPENVLQKSYDKNSQSKKLVKKIKKLVVPISKKEKPIRLKNKTKTSIVDDDFFNLQEMEKFLINEEKMEGKVNQNKNIDSEDDSIDMFEDIDDKASNEDEEEPKHFRYSDFYDSQDGEDPVTWDDGSNNMECEDFEMADDHHTKTLSSTLSEPKRKEKKVRFSVQESDVSDSENINKTREKKVNKNAIVNTGMMSDFEHRQQRLLQHISILEEKSLTEAPWQLKGEVDATKRPQNSLLEEVVDFDLTTRPVPVITEQTTLTLEEIIKGRIKDKAWDDVVKKEKPMNDQLVFKKPQILDQMKSKESLAQVYEMEYLKQKQLLSGADEEEKEPESYTEIRNGMKKLFAQLDALCHYHYTPKAPQAQVKIVSNTPAISMEEVAPIATSHAALLAPEEVKKKHRGDLMSKAERTQTDKNRERRKKKKLQKQKGKAMKVTEHRNTVKGVESNTKALKTSKAFFQQLNDDATSLIKAKSKRNVKNKGQ